MHHDLPLKYCFIDGLNTNLIKIQDKYTAIIFRKYTNNIIDNKLIIKIRNLCRKNGNKFILSNNIKLAIKLKLDGIYIPSFNKSFSHLSYSLPNNFLIIGSAHSLKEIKIKELQKVSAIFISSIFKKNKNYLGINRFKIIIKHTKKKIVALGGINKKNLKKLNLVNCNYFGGISYFK